jgi:cell wall-associated NlpC family hydrolase
MTTRTQVVTECLSWANTPWVHQGVLKGLGADCEGYIEGVLVNAAVEKAADVARNWRRREDGSLMLKMLAEHLDFVTGNSGREAPDMSKALPADIIAFCDERVSQPDVPRHLGFLTKRRADGTLYVSHASEHGVVNHRMDARWQKRIHSVWSIRGIVNDLDA